MRRSALMLWVAAAAMWTGTAAAAEASFVLDAKRIFPSPTDPPIDDGRIVVRDGVIVAVGPRAKVAAPAAASVADCDGGLVTAGFQNSHVHFTEPHWEGSAKQPADQLSKRLTDMLTRFGFTTVVDTGSNPYDTLPLRSRIESGEVAGPRILTAGISVYPHEGIPIYLRDLPPHILERLPEPATVEEAVRVVRANLDLGADATKLFVATPQGNRKLAYMSRDIAAAAARETHARHRLVLAHPSNNEGIRIAIAAGVDVLVHTTIEENPAQWPPAMIGEMIARGMSVVPTLQLWPYESVKAKLPPKVGVAVLGDAVEQLRAFHAAGGQVLFGTDVGYMAVYDPTDEYVYMSRALQPMQILASLTTAPAARWKESDTRGRLAPGLQADLTVLNGDPTQDVRQFAQVRCTFRKGRLLYRMSPVTTAGVRPS